MSVSIACAYRGLVMIQSEDQLKVSFNGRAQTPYAGHISQHPDRDSEVMYSVTLQLSAIRPVQSPFYFHMCPVSIV